MAALCTRSSVALALAIATIASGSFADEPREVVARSAPADLDLKAEGAFTDALPLVAYDTNTGLGLGLGAHLTLNGRRDDPFFAHTPYRHRFYVQGYGTTGGYQQHQLTYEGIHIADSAFRVKAVASYERNTSANYFGNGASTLSDLSYRGVTFPTYAAAVAAAGPHYFTYGYDKPQGQLVVERGFWGGMLRVDYGVNVQHVTIRPNEPPSVFAPATKLGADCASGAALGCGGGWNNLLRGRIALDTRDFEPDPNSGSLVDVTGQWSSRGFGSAFDYVRLTAAARSYVSPAPKLADLVLATRVLYSIQSARVPFFAMDTLAMTAGTDDATDQQGLGGERTLRGYRQDRFIGRVAVAANQEIRWTFAKFPLFRQRFSLQLAPFVDAGRVFDKVDLSLSDWKVAAGGGLRVGWNQSTIIIFDLGMSREDTGFFIDFGLPF